jgi:hypothetical protein
LAFAPFAVGALLLFVLLFRTRLVPRYIAVWGVAAVALATVFNVIGADVTTFGPAVLLVVPIMLNELWLAGRLIVKGFDQQPAAVQSAPGAGR